MDNNAATTVVNPINTKMALCLAYDYLSQCPDSDKKAVYLLSGTGKKITLQDSMEAIKSYACSI